MKKSTISFVTSLAVFSLAITFSISIQPAHAQTVNCPAGYTCTPIATQPAGCPAGYTCTPVTVSSVTSTPPSTTSSCYSIPTNLYLGSTGNTISSLQTWLMNNGFDISAISSGKTGTGYYGNQTAGALAKYLASQKYRNCNASPTVPTQPTTPIQTTSQSCQGGQVWNGISCVAYSGAVTPIEILLPTSGQSVSQGSYLDISWQHGIDKAGQNVTLYIRLLGQDSLSGGAYTQIVQNIVNGQNLSVSISVPSDGDWKWLVPSTVQPGQYEIQIIESLVGTAGSPSDIVVSAPFTITASNGTVSQTCPAGQTWNASWGSCSVQVQQTSGQPYVKIISPDGGQTYSPGQVVPIQFSTNLTSQQAPNGFNIWAYYGGNSTNVGSYASGVPNIVMNYTGGTTYYWTVPSSWSTGNYVIYIVPASVVGVSNTGLFAFGDSYFTITSQTTSNPTTCPSNQTWNGSSCVSTQSGSPSITNVQTDKTSYNVGDSYTATWNLTNAQANSQIIIALENSSGARVYNLTCVPLVTNSCANIPAVNGLGTYTGVIPAGVGQIGSSVSNGQYKFEVELITNGAFTTDGVSNQTVSIPLGGGSASTANASVQVSANGSPTLQKNIITTGGGSTQTVQYMANFSVNVQAVGAPVTLGLTGSSWPAFVATAAGIQINKNGVADSLGNYIPIINYQIPSGATSNGTSFTIPTGTTVTIPVTIAFTVTNPGANVYSVQLLGMGWSSATQSSQIATLGGSTWQTQSQ